jgi:ABC-type sugar transport system ATPase subunit
MPFLQLEGIRKAYAGAEVLHGIELEAERGEVLAIAGANGAGKSTLIKILSGAVDYDAGEISLDGTRVRLADPAEAQSLGIRTVYQELSLVPQISVAENLLLGRLPRSRGLVDWPAAHDRAQGLLDRAGFGDINTRANVSELTVARQQMVEIAKALAAEPRVLILDEPSAVLAGDDLDRVFRLIDSLREQGTLILYISHRLEEVLDIADRIAVIRDGLVVEVVRPAETDPSELVRLMAGRGLDRVYPDRRAQPGSPLLAAAGLGRDGAFSGVSLSVASGEILGLFGLVGSGRTEVARCLFGADRATAGTIEVAGTPVVIDRPATAIAHGIAFVTEDRQRDGLVMGLPVRENALLASMREAVRLGFLDPSRENSIVGEQVKRLGISPPRPELLARHLSGGNQQKVVLAKWLLTRPRVLILDEPTRGVDMATRVELYRMFDELTRSGIGLLLISSDLTEVLGATDRVLVMRDGRLAGEFASAASTEEDLLGCAVGVAA